MIFLDSGAWVALAVADDKHAQEAKRLQAAIARREHGAMVTTDFVLDEAATCIRMSVDVEAAAKFVHSILGSASVTVVWIDPGKFRAALNLFEQNRDKRWSFTDCTSFVVMRELGIEQAFAFDRNFEEAGFARLP